MSLRRRMARGDDGFSLAEILVALGLLLGVALAAAPVFWKSFQRTAGQGQRQTAVAVAGQTLDLARAIDPARMVSGRYKADVQALEAAGNLGLVDLSTVDTTKNNYDSAATSGSASAAIPLTQTVVQGNTKYTVRTYVDQCYRAQSTGVCSNDSSSGNPPIWHIAVDVAWSMKLGQTCASARAGYCEYVATTYRDATADPIFNRTVSQPTITTLTSNPATIYFGQQSSLSLAGAGYATGASIGSDNPNDAVTNVTITSAGLATATIVAGPNGPRNISLANPDGGNVSTVYNVGISNPAISNVVGSTVRGTSVAVTLNGTNFYKTAATTAVLPTITLTFTPTGRSPITLPFTNEQLASASALTFNVNTSGLPAGGGVLLTTVSNPDYPASPMATNSVSVTFS